MRYILAFSTLLVVVAALPSTSKLVTFYSEKDYEGSNYSLTRKSVDRCVDFTRAPLVVESVQISGSAEVKLYSSLGCIGLPVKSVIEDTSDTGHIEVRSVFVSEP
ncbi:MAG: hypothetical protein BYD32DRAFT_217048 [Podila humilis]|nr:MAG: hypothetical protein BYD32DRAFT_217048 [Podila humilis]